MRGVYAEVRSLPLTPEIGPHHAPAAEDEVLHRYAVRYMPGQRLYYGRAHPQEKADVVIDNEDPDHPSLRLSESRA